MTGEHLRGLPVFLRAPRPMPRWPLLLIGAPAAVAIWSGWVGLGGLCGFGPVDLLPGIGGGFHLNTAICLPVGVEAFAGYALAVWLRSSPVPGEARQFAKRAAIGALALGMLGQIAFHVLSSLHVTRAPIGVVVAVSCMPVAVVGLAASLAHLMSRETGDGLKSSSDHAVPVAASVSASVPASLPGLREIQRRRNCSQGTAKKIRAELLAYERSRGGAFPGAQGAAPAAQDPRPGLAVPPGAVPAGAGPPAGALIPANRGAPARAPNGQVNHA